MPTLRSDVVSAQFPSFAFLKARGMSYFDSAARSLPTRHCAWRLSRGYNERAVEPFGASEVSGSLTRELAEAEDRVARLLGVRVDELHFGPSTSANLYVLAQGLRDVLKPGSTIIVSDQDHEANSGPWWRLAEFGFRVLEWKMNPSTGYLDPDVLERLLDDSTSLVCFPHSSSIVGEVNAVAEITEMVRRAGALSCVDGVAQASHDLPNVGRLGADIYVISAHKFFGPHVGLMVVRRAVAELLHYQGPDGDLQPSQRRLLPGSPDYVQIAACAGIADYIDALYDAHFKAGRDAVGRAAAVFDLTLARERRLIDPVIDFLAHRNGVRLIGPTDVSARVGIVSFSHATPAPVLANALAERGIIVGAGHLGSTHALKALGLNSWHGVVRLSVSHHTSDEDMARLMQALDQVL